MVNDNAVKPVGVAVLGLTLLQLGCAARANLLATRAASGLKDALEAHAPAFAVYYAAVVGARTGARNLLAVGGATVARQRTA